MLHYFNPGHEAAVLNASPYYIPPANVRQLQWDLAFLPAWYAEPGDQVLLPAPLDADYALLLQRHFPTLPHSVTDAEVTDDTASPWGISPQALHHLEEIACRQKATLRLPTWHDAYRYLNSRAAARDCLSTLLEALPDIDPALLPRPCGREDEVRAIIHHSAHVWLAKAPYSSSGRGLLWLPRHDLSEKTRDVLRGMLRKQGRVYVERVLDKVADFSMQFMQNHVSKNWHKGGESNFSLLGTWNVEANYDNKRKITFENKLEMKLGFQTSKSDKMHKFKTNNDQLRLTNKFGLRAIGDWSYNFMLQSWTQFYPGYKSNDAFVYSDILSPLDAVFSVGMAYNKSFRKANLSINPSPLAYNFRYVKRNSLIGSMGLKEGHHTQYTLGSTITANLSWTIAKNIQWTSRFYYFTDYKKVQAEWENTFTLTINKYLSTQLFLYPRYDDGVTRQPGRSYFQFSEWLSFRLNMSFQK